MSTLLGSSGSISALDLAQDNIATVQRRVNDGEFACPVEARTASLTSLPYGNWLVAAHLETTSA